MCVDKKLYITKSHLISLDHFQPGYINVNCGKCCECLDSRKNDWYIRSYYEALDCIRKGGFCLFDTLTYRDSDLPTIRRVLFEDRKKMDWDFSSVPDDLNFPCFSKRDVQLFFKRLRKHFDDESVRFFLCGEYGSEDEYVDERGNVRVGTARPHYHVIFFVTASVDPIEFSRIVASEWIHGRTDGVPYKGVLYVRSKRLFRVHPCDYHFNNLINYFQKYTLKNGEFQKEIDSRIYRLVKNDVDENEYYFNVMSRACIDSYGDDEASQKLLHSANRVLYHHFPRKKYNAVRRMCSQFISSSHGYGACALEDPQFTATMDLTGNVLISRKDKTVVRLSLPSYYYRKRYYETYTNRYGKRAWRLSQIGIDHVASLWSHRVDNKRHVLRALLHEARVNFDDRLLEELVDYVLVYRGAVGRDLYRSSAFNDYLSRYYVSSVGRVVYNHNTYSAACHYGKRFVSGKDKGVAGAWLDDPPVFEMISPTAFFDATTFFDDRLESILVKIGYIKDRHDRAKQSVFDKKNCLKTCMF